MDDGPSVAGGRSRRRQTGVILRKVYLRGRSMALHAGLRGLLRVDGAPGLEKIGSGYGGWIVPSPMIDSDWIVYNGGVGEDLTFDEGLIERFGCRVFAFDPTPRAIAFAQRFSERHLQFTFRPCGLWSSDTRLRFYAPRDPAHVSHSVANLQQTSEFFEAECRSVPSLMRELGHDHIDLLKLDVEGAEYEVLASILEAGLKVRVICVEFDQPARPRRLWRLIRRVITNGYRLVSVDGWNFTFVRRHPSAA